MRNIGSAALPMTALLWLATLTHQLVPRQAIRRVPAALPRRRRPLCSSAGDPFWQTAIPPAEQLHVAGLSYDLETTGLGPGAEIVQIAVHVANSAKSEPPSFEALVLPSGPITPDASAVHGLTRQRLEAAGAQPFGVVWQQIEAWLGQTLGTERPLVWCAHNGQRGCIKGLPPPWAPLCLRPIGHLDHARAAPSYPRPPPEPRGTPRGSVAHC